MIEQSSVGLDSRSQAHPYNEDGMLPLIASPMYSVVNKDFGEKLLKNKIRVAFPRNTDIEYSGVYWKSVSLNEFKQDFLSANKITFNGQIKVLIDVANGNMPVLHRVIKDAKKVYGDSLIIMAGNVGSVDAFMSLARSGADYIRVGIGGGGACTSTVHTGVGQDCLKFLVDQCNVIRFNHNLSVKIVADGISFYIRKNCLHRNGYAAINELLWNGADIVMVGTIFGSLEESAAEKKPAINSLHGDVKMAKISGMSTKEEQSKYKQGEALRPSEGHSFWRRVETGLDGWLNGDEEKGDEFPGWLNAIRSAMSYTGSEKIEDFKKW